MIVGKARIRDGLRVYAIGDIHGCLKELKALIALIDQDLAENPAEKHKLVFLGDYIDRGPDNREVITALLRLKRSKRKTIFLRGNHDEKLLDFLKSPEKAGEGFLKWGGAATLRGYGVSFQCSDSFKSISSKLKKRIPKSHILFLKRLKNAHAEGDYFFAHAGVRPGVDLDQQQKEDLIKIRGEFMKHAAPFSKVIVHGHTPVTKPDVRPNRIDVDTRCYDTGRLTALVLEGRQHRFLQTGGGNEK